jgi:hypothetical protein
MLPPDQLDRREIIARHDVVRKKMAESPNPSKGSRPAGPVPRF